MTNTYLFVHFAAMYSIFWMSMGALCFIVDIPPEHAGIAATALLLMVVSHCVLAFAARALSWPSAGMQARRQRRSITFALMSYFSITPLGPVLYSWGLNALSDVAASVATLLALALGAVLGWNWPRHLLRTSTGTEPKPAP